jgi:hypothetical protein
MQITQKEHQHLEKSAWLHHLNMLPQDGGAVCNDMVEKLKSR